MQFPLILKLYKLLIKHRVLKRQQKLIILQCGINIKKIIIILLRKMK